MKTITFYATLFMFFLFLIFQKTASGVDTDKVRLTLDDSIPYMSFDTEKLCLQKAPLDDSMPYRQQINQNQVIL
ncbi:MAG: hypothetical protein L3J74_10855 [Bacteroidales bacterium]|nr:hypothetical protein [Bacteroidales bacterium]